MYDNILVPIALDHVDHADASLEVARCLLNEGGKITILNVIEDIPTFAQSYLPDGTLQQNATLAVEAIEKLAETDGHNYNTQVVHGKPSLAILDCATKNNADCVVIASHKPGLEDYFIGSTASRVVRHAKCCVHVLR